MKKRVLFVITKGNFGGAQKYVYNLSTNLPSDYFEVTVACGEGDSLKNKLENKNIKTIELGSSQRDMSVTKDIKNLLEIFLIIRKEKPDILHLNSSKAGGIGTFIGRMLGIKKIIFTSHGWAFNEERNSFEKILIYFFHWLTVIFSHITIAVSSQTEKDISWLPFIRKKIKVVHNGIEPFTTLREEESNKIIPKPRDGSLILFTIAELHKNKGLDVAIKAIAALPQKIKDRVVYYIAGEGDERLVLEKMISEYGLENQVHLLGFIENAKKLLSGVDIFIFPSRNENLPFAILEAGYAQLPIISTNVGGIGEIIEDSKNGILVHKNNPKEITEAIVYTIENKNNIIEFGSQIKKKVETIFSLKKMVEKTIELYNS